MTAQNLKSATLQFLAATIPVMGFVLAHIGIVAVLLFSTATASAEELFKDDQVVASFERALNHERPVPAIVKRSDIEDDVLYGTINSIHWSKSAEQAESLASDETTGADNSAEDADLLAAQSESSNVASL